MDINPPLMVNCGDHGERVSAVICRHMLHAQPMPAGFIENSDDPSNLQAWCYLCEEKFQEENGMTESFREFNGMAVVCVVCYEEAKQNHVIIGS